MVDFPEDFNVADVPEDDRSFEPLPAGEYTMQIIESDVKPTKKSGGEQLVLTIEVIDGPLANRRMWDRLNIRNQNADAQRISQRSLADLCIAVGVQSLRNTEDLHFKPFVGRVTIKVDKKGEFPPSNAIRYKPRGGQPPVNKPAAQQSRPAGSAPPPQKAAATGGARPWR